MQDRRRGGPLTIRSKGRPVDQREAHADIDADGEGELSDVHVVGGFGGGCRDLGWMIPRRGSREEAEVPRVGQGAEGPVWRIGNGMTPRIYRIERGASTVGRAGFGGAHKTVKVPKHGLLFRHLYQYESARGHPVLVVKDEVAGIRWQEGGAKRELLAC
mgnify:CR=1 FL=1